MTVYRGEKQKLIFFFGGPDDHKARMVLNESVNG